MLKAASRPLLSGSRIAGVRCMAYDRPSSGRLDFGGGESADRNARGGPRRERAPGRFQDSSREGYSPSGQSPFGGRDRAPPRPVDLNPLVRGSPPSLLTLADLSVDQLSSLLTSALTFKMLAKASHRQSTIRPSLANKTVALIFSKRSTRTRVASETATKLLGGHPMFLGAGDIQLGVNETLEDSAKVIGSMVDGIMARVGEHSEVEELAKHSAVPVVNALSARYHPTQILADLLTLWETYAPVSPPTLEPGFRQNGRPKSTQTELYSYLSKNADPFACLKGKKMAWVGDTNNIINEILVTVPRLGMEVSVASPKGYDQVEPAVWDRVKEAGTESLITLTNSPAEALKNADVVVTDTWISMGQETEKAARLKAFEGYQITNSMVSGAGAKDDWKFLHCLPRKQEEVDDEVFYGDRSLVFPEAENRKWTIMACFDFLYGQWKVPGKWTPASRGSDGESGSHDL